MALPYDKYADAVCEDVLHEIERVARHMRNWDMALHTLLMVLAAASAALHGLATSNGDFINHLGIGLAALNSVTIGIIKFSHFGETHTHLRTALADLKAFANTRTPLPREILRDITKINTLCYKHPLVGVPCLQGVGMLANDSDFPSVLNL